MGLDATIYKTPVPESVDVKYWRKNWVLQNWMEAENCVDMLITVSTMESLLEFIDKQEESMESMGWTDDDWDTFADEIREVIEDMKRDETYEYIYNGGW